MCALAVAGSPLRRAFGLSLATFALATPYLLPASHHVARTALAIFVFVGCMRVIDLMAVQWGPAERVKHVLSAVDSRKTLRVPRSLDARSLVKVAAWGVVAAACWWLLVRAAPGAPPGPCRWLARWASGLAFIYTLTEAVYALILAGHAAVGLRTPTLHRHPAASRSVQEFWGYRWNRTVSAWLGETFFRPFARRRRPWLGVLLAFVVSAIAHAYIALVAAGFAMAGLMLLFFVLQGVVILLEFALGTARWRPGLGHAWTILWMVGASPLFTEPFLRMIGV